MHLSPIEIKVNIEDDVAAALKVLGASSSAMTTRRIWFAEDQEGVAQGRVRRSDAVRKGITGRLKCVQDQAHALLQRE